MARHRLEPKRSPSEAMALATDNLGLLFAAVNKAVHDRTKRDECVQDAWFYFYRAAQLFDSDRDAEFSTYAYSYLRGSILTSLRSSRCIGGIPDAVAVKFRRLERDAVPSSDIDEAIAQGFKRRDGQRYRWDAQAFFTFVLGERSLSEPVSRSGSPNPLTIEDTIADDGPSAEDDAADASRSALAHRLLAAAPLTDRERMVVEARFFADPEETLQEIGDRIGICKERVRQIEAVALRKLRDAAKKIAR